MSKQAAGTDRQEQRGTEQSNPLRSEPTRARSVLFHRYASGHQGTCPSNHTCMVQNTCKAAVCIRRAHEGDGSILLLGSRHPKTFHSLLVMLLLELVMKNLSEGVGH